MADHSHLDEKYFIDHAIYNCPYCKRRRVRYSLHGYGAFDWAHDKQCFYYLVKCHDCEKTSFHLSFYNIKVHGSYCFKHDIDIDAHLFYSVPTSFFVMDARIPAAIRELITEGEGALKMNFLTGASACARKAIYELTVLEKCEGKDYEEKIKSLKAKYPSVDETLIDTLAHIQDMTSDKIHEQSWPKWDSRSLHMIIETLKAILHEIYVVPDEKKQRVLKIQKMKGSIAGDKKKVAPVEEASSDEQKG